MCNNTYQWCWVVLFFRGSQYSRQQQTQIKMAGVFFPWSPESCLIFKKNIVVDERLPSDEIRFSSVIDEIGRRRLPQMTFVSESLFERKKRLFWMYFQIVSTFLRNLQGFLWETPKLFLCGFGQNYLVFSYQISKRLNSWLFWRKGNTFHIEKSPLFFSIAFFFFSFPHFWQAKEYKSTWNYSSCVMKFHSENKIYSFLVFACCSTSQCQYIRLTISHKYKHRLVFLPLQHCKYHYG